MDFQIYIRSQKEWSLSTFGKGKRTEGIVKHIQSELDEILKAETDMDRLEECIDVIILAMDMAWRLGYEPITIEGVLLLKQAKNRNRIWPPVEISEANQDKPTFHVRK